MSLVFAVTCGAVFTLNTITIQWAIHLGCDIDQANYDSYFILTVICLPFFLYELEVNKTPYTFDDAIISAAIIWIMALCIQSFSRAIEVGMAGRCCAIENTKAII